MMVVFCFVERLSNSMAHHAHDIPMKIPWNFSIDFEKLPVAEGKRLSHCGGGCVVPQHMGHVPWKQPKTVVKCAGDMVEHGEHVD